MKLFIFALLAASLVLVAGAPGGTSKSEDIGERQVEKRSVDDEHIGERQVEKRSVDVEHIGERQVEKRSVDDEDIGERQVEKRSVDEDFEELSAEGGCGHYGG